MAYRYGLDGLGGAVGGIWVYICRLQAQTGGTQDKVIGSNVGGVFFWRE